MWLLHTETLHLEDFVESCAPSYAILSHTWGNDEISLVEMQGDHDAARWKSGFKKIKSFCLLAREHGFTHGWVDTCCIDKRSSAELSEAINSMYRYYYNAGECLVYLEDVPAKSRWNENPEHQLYALTASRWFTRGWTLQELLASKRRYFFASDWSSIESWIGFDNAIAAAAGIDKQVLQDRDMITAFPVAHRMSWASTRETTRSEDIAYSLMGLFDVKMPILYGEGAKKAFRRLQNEIMQTSFDQTLFAWRSESRSSSGLLATSPADFLRTPRIALWDPVALSPFVMTNVGLSIRIARMGSSDQLPWDAQAGENSLAALQCDIIHEGLWKILLIHLEPVGKATFFVNGKLCKAYRRVNCAQWVPVFGNDLKSWPDEDVLILEDEHYELLKHSIEDNQKRWGFGI